MKKLVLGLAIASALGLSACGDETLKDVQEEVKQENQTVIPTSRVVFDPSNGVLSVPNDLLFQGSTDGTLNIPVDDPTDYGNPLVAANALDGWSTQQPFVLGITFPSGVSLDGGSVFSPASVKIFETTMGGSTADADCTAVPRGVACKIVKELTFGQDFVAQASGNSIAVVPLKPLAAKTTYIVVLTNNLQDSTGKAIDGSTTYNLVKQDINTMPLGSAAQRGLQGIINSFENAVATTGVDKEDIIYTAAITTQSTIDALGVTKQLLVADPTAIPAVSAVDTGITVAQALISAGQIPADDPMLVPLYSSAKLMSGKITLPYYLGTPTAENPRAPVDNFWTAACDSGAMLLGLAAANPAAIPAEPQSANDAFCMNFGLRDLGIDTERNITQYNPIPKVTSMQTLDVQITMPDPTVANAVRASLGLPADLATPETGWPIVMLQHGITSKKEDMLAITGLLSLYGFATAAIDHPLHGSRGFDIDPTSPGDEINASTISATHYMNLANLLATRDNGRQSIADMLGLRVGLNFFPGINPTKVHFLGHSLGAITGNNFVALANTALNPAVDGLFALETASLAMPGSAVANFLFDSAAFGDLIRGNLLYASSTDFQAFVAANLGAVVPNGPDWEGFLVATYRSFWNNILSAEQQAQIQGTFDQFVFAAQSVTDAMDPNNYASLLVATQTPLHIIEVVGDGGDNLPDQVIPNTTSAIPTGGTEGLIALLGLPGVSETTSDQDGVSGAVRFIYGNHSSILSPAGSANNARATQEMQSQVANFFATNGTAIVVTDTGVVK